MPSMPPGPGRGGRAARFAGVQQIDRPLARRTPSAKLVRFAGVSLLGTVLTQVMLFVLVDGFGWSGVPANITAVVVSTVPSFFLNKAWVWSHDSKHSLHRQVLPYWGLSLAGLVLSTFFAWLAYRAVRSGWAVSLANLGGFGLLWLVKFRVLDLYLFPDHHHHRVGPEPTKTPNPPTTNQLENP